MSVQGSLIDIYESVRGPYQYCDSETKSAQGLLPRRENFSLPDFRTFEEIHIFTLEL